MDQVYLYALGSNLSFALGSQFFTHYSRRFSSAWMNCFKASCSLFFFIAVTILFGEFHTFKPLSLVFFFISGAMGLGFGDVFLLEGFRRMGPGRTMMLFSFQPIILGVFSFILFDQALGLSKIGAIFCFILCLLTLSLESFKKSGHWEVMGLTMALIGMTLDSCGILMSRYAFDNSPLVTSMEANVYRTFGAVSFFIFFARVRPFNWVSNLKSLNRRSLSFIVMGSMLGTFISLSLYLKAVQKGNLATVSGLAITGVMFSTFFESIWEKKKPTLYFGIAFCFFLIGMRILVF